MKRQEDEKGNNYIQISMAFFFLIVHLKKTAIRRGSEWKKGKGVESRRVMSIKKGKDPLKENLCF